METEGSDEGVKRRKLRSVKSADSLLSVSSNLSTIRDSRQYSGNVVKKNCFFENF